jgi:UDP-N-acetyl-D-mannosaminuronic acid dehydrogenase
MRESPALHIVERLAREKIGEILVVEPNIRRLPPSLVDFSHVRRSELQPALNSADIIVLLVDHRQFKRVDRELLNLRIVVDTRGLWR